MLRNKYGAGQVINTAEVRTRWSWQTGQCQWKESETNKDHITIRSTNAAEILLKHYVAVEINNVVDQQQVHLIDLNIIVYI